MDIVLPLTERTYNSIYSNCYERTNNEDDLCKSVAEKVFQIVMKSKMNEEVLPIFNGVTIPYYK